MRKALREGVVTCRCKAVFDPRREQVACRKCGRRYHNECVGVPLSDGDGVASGDWMTWVLVGIGAGVPLLLLCVACCFKQPRRLCVLLCTHPNPGMGPLYLPQDTRLQYAQELGLKKDPGYIWAGISKVLCFCVPRCCRRRRDSKDPPGLARVQT